MYRVFIITLLFIQFFSSLADEDLAFQSAGLNPQKQVNPQDHIENILNMAIKEEEKKMEGENINIDKQRRGEENEQNFQNGFEDGEFDQYIDEISPWIVEEEKKLETAPQLQVQESFSFLIEGKDEKIFKWNPSKNKNLSLEVYAYFLTDVGELAIPQSTEKSQNIQIFTKKNQSASYYHLEEIYVHSLLSINFDTDYRILRFRNNYKEIVLLSVDCEFPGRVIDKGLDDDDLFQTKKKIHETMKMVETTQVKRSHESKLEKGFLERENSHQHVLLVLTGIELIGIICGALVQIMWIKNLIQNRQIV